MHTPKRGMRRSRRGVAVVSFIAALLIIGTLVLWLFQLTASTTTSTLSHYYSTGAFYASESGIELALRELTSSPATDIDSDGTIGTISDNGDDNDDPALSTGRVVVERVSTTPPTYRATGRPAVTSGSIGSYRRILEIETQ